jgi:hypothetical protein
MESLLNDPDIEGPVTLGLVRDRLRRARTGHGLKADLSPFGTEDSLYAEVEALVEEFGEQALAADFTAVKASEELSAVIEAVLDEGGRRSVPTLGTLREAVDRGLLARMAGDGLIDPDQNETLIAEIDALIERFGSGRPAEQLLRFE